jgi:exosortase/archaeosortase family protein
MRLIGVLACSAAILGVNLIRIISLFYIGQYSMEWFDWAHLYAWDILIMLDGLVAILLWIRYALSHTPKTAPVDALHS